MFLNRPCFFKVMKLVDQSLVTQLFKLFVADLEVGFAMSPGA